MKRPPGDPPPGVERVVDAISDGGSVEWERELDAPDADRETLAALRLIDHVARLHRGEAGTAREGAEPLARGSTWGGMRILGRLGTGAYGEVYRAFDPGLRREVALKLWSVTVRPHIIERLLEEARTLAGVRHPNVLVVHGADVHDGRVGMWTELLEGSTLEQLIEQHGSGHWYEAARYGIEVCRSLAAVHSLGVVHGDVKASNVMRERGGRIVLLDFGSASRFREDDEGPASGLQGTPLAMAPELLRGAPASPASDLYSLGALLFRVVTARHPVEADSLEQLRERLEAGPAPTLRALRPDVPLEFSTVVERALERDPAARPRSAAEMERQLADALGSDLGRASIPANAPPAAPAGSTRGRVARWAAAAGALALVAAGAWWIGRGPTRDPGRPMQFTLQLPAGEHLVQYANLVVSPDGGSIAFASTDSLGRNALWVRRLDARTSTRIPGTEGARYPFWSPDSRNVAFFTGQRLKSVGVDGGAVRALCGAELGRGGTWNGLGTILFAGSTRGPLMRVPAGGGTPVPATELDTTNSEVSHRWPCFLPDGDHFLYVTSPGTDGTYGLFVGSLHSGRRAFVGAVESGASYSSGLLVYVLNKTLEARPFSLRTLRWSGDPVPVSDLPGIGGSLAEPHASVSGNGTLVSRAVATRESRMEWIDTRSGDARNLSIGPYFGPSVSPDGRRIAVERVEGTGRSNVWMVDAESGAAKAWTSDLGLNRSPRWSPAGDSIVFSSNRDGRYALYVRGTGGSLEEKRVYAPPNALLLWPNDWCAGGLLAFDQFEPGTAYNVYELRAGTPFPVARTPASEMRSALSPDTRWLAYDSDASGRSQVYVVDRRTSERYVLPDEGGMQPRWARVTGRLYYRTAAGEFFERRPVRGLPPPDWPMRRLFRAGVIESYDVDPRGTRLLCCLRSESGRPEEVDVLINLPQAVAHGL